MASKQVFQHVLANDAGCLRKVLSQYESAVGAKNAQGKEPLHVAAQLGFLECVRELLRAKAAFDENDSYGNTPLHLAAEQGHVDVIQELVTGSGRKSVLKNKNKDGRTPLHLAAKGNHPAAVAKLIESGARVDAKDKNGQTPLQLAPHLNQNEAMEAAFSGQYMEQTEASHMAEHGQLVPVMEGESGIPLPAMATPPPAHSHVSVASHQTGTTAFASKASVQKTPTTPRSSTRSVSAMPRVNLRASMDLKSSQVLEHGALGARKPPALSPHNSRASSSTSLGRNGGTASATPAATPAGAQRGHTSDASVAALQLAVKELQAGLEEAKQRAAAAEAAAAEQQELAARLAQALDSINEQSSRLEGVEERLVMAEEKGRNLRTRMDQADDEAKGAKAATLERMQAQDLNLRALQSSLSSVTKEQQAAQATLQQLTLQVSQSGSAPAPAISRGESVVSSCGGAVDASASAGGPFEVAPEVASLRVSMASLRGLPEKVEELSLQVAQLGAGRTAVAGEVDALRSRLTRLESVGAGDQLELLSLKVQQMGTSLSSLNNTHAELADKLAALNRWRAEQAAVGTSGGGAVGAGAAGTAAAAGALMAEVEAQVVQRLGPTQKAVEALEQQVAELKSEMATKLAPPLVPPPTPSTPGPSGPPTPSPLSIHQPASARRERASAAASMAATEELSVVAADLQALQATVNDLKAHLDDARSEMRLAALELKREWEGAVAEAGVRYAEQRLEIEAREARVKAMRDSVMREEEARASAAAFEERAGKALKVLEKGLGLMQHKVEVLEDTVTGIQQQVDAQGYASQRASFSGMGSMGAVTARGARASFGAHTLLMPASPTDKGRDWAQGGAAGPVAEEREQGGVPLAVASVRCAPQRGAADGGAGVSPCKDAGASLGGVEEPSQSPVWCVGGQGGGGGGVGGPLWAAKDGSTSALPPWSTAYAAATLRHSPARHSAACASQGRGAGGGAPSSPHGLPLQLLRQQAQAAVGGLTQGAVSGSASQHDAAPAHPGAPHAANSGARTQTQPPQLDAAANNKVKPKRPECTMQ